MFYKLSNLLLPVYIRVLVAKNNFKSLSKEGFFKFLILLFVGVMFLVLDYLFFYRLINYIFSLEDSVGRILISQLLRVILVTFLSMLFFSNIITSFSTLYISLDLDFLLYCPIPTYSVFISKFIQTVFNSSWMIALFGFPIFLALGKVYGMELKFYLILFLLFIPFAIISANFGILVTMVLVCLFPAKKTHQVMTFLGIIFAVGLVLLLRFSQPERLIGDVPDEMIISFLKNIEVPDYWFMPSTWGAEAIKSSLDGRYIATYKMLRLFYLTSVATFLSVVFVASRIYLSGVMRAKVSIRNLRDENVTGTDKHGFRSTGLTGSLRLEREYSLKRKISEKVFNRIATYKTGPSGKDIILFARDPARWSQTFMLFGLIVIYFFNIYNLPLNTFFLKNLISFLNLGLAGFVLSALSVRFVFPAISLEGTSMWILLSGPVKYRSYLWGKFFLFFFPLFIISEILIVVSNFILKVDNYMMFLSAVTMFFITLAIVGLGVGFGAIYPKLRFDDPAQVSISTGGILFMIISLIYVGLVIVLEAGPVYVFFQYKLFYRNLEGIWIYLSYLSVVFISFLAGYIPMKLGEKHLEKIEI